MDDPGKVMVAVALFGSVAYSIRTISRAWIARQVNDAKREPLDDARLARLEQAVDAIALEVERISEGQRFTTKLLSEQARPAPSRAQQQLSSNTPI